MRCVLQGPDFQALEIQDPKKYFIQRAASTASDAVKPDPHSHAVNDIEPMHEDGEGVIFREPIHHGSQTLNSFLLHA